MYTKNTQLWPVPKIFKKMCLPKPMGVNQKKKKKEEEDDEEGKKAEKRKKTFWIFLQNRVVLWNRISSSRRGRRHIIRLFRSKKTMRKLCDSVRYYFEGGDWHSCGLAPSYLLSWMPSPPPPVRGQRLSTNVTFGQTFRPRVTFSWGSVFVRRWMCEQIKNKSDKSMDQFYKNTELKAGGSLMKSEQKSGN